MHTKFYLKEEREGKKERLNDGNNNSQATHGARKPPGPKKILTNAVIYKFSLKWNSLQKFLSSVLYKTFSFKGHCIQKEMSLQVPL